MDTLPKRTTRARQVIALALVGLTAVLSIVSLLGGYVRGELLDTERYVAIVGPLARDPAVQAQVVDAVTAAVVDNVRVDDVTGDVLEVLRARDDRLARLLSSDRRLAQALDGVLSGLGPMLQNQLETATRRVAQRVVEDPRFAELWVQANRSAHTATLAALRDEGRAVRTDGGEVRIDIAVIVEEVKRRLVDNGFALADRIPTTDQQLVLVRSEEMAKVQAVLRIFDQTAPWLPWVTLAIAVAAVAVAPERRRAVVWLGAAVSVAMVLVLVALGLARGVFLQRVAATSVRPEAAAAIVDAALDPLWARTLFVTVTAVLVTVVAVLAGPVGTAARRRLSGTAAPAQVDSATTGVH